MSYLVSNRSCVWNETKPVVDDGGVAGVLWDFVGPIIFIIGIIGNIFILLVMTRPSMRGTSTCAYLVLMASADLFVLISGMLPEWLEASGFLIFKELSPWSCKLEKFFFYTSGDTAIWIRVMFTLDRFMAVCFPLHQTDCCLPERAKYYSLGLGALLAAIAKNFHVFFTRGAEYSFMEKITLENCTIVEIPSNTSILISNCGSPTPDSKYFEQYVRPWIAFAVVSVLPFCIILLCNMLIVTTLINVRRKRSELQLMSATHNRNVIQMTVLCLSASFCFLVCTAPSITLLIGKPYWNNPPSESYEVVKAISNQLYYVNHSANFFLYCITGQRFREELMGVFTRRRYSHIASSLRGVYSGSLVEGRASQSGYGMCRQTSQLSEGVKKDDSWSNGLKNDSLYGRSDSVQISRL